MKKICNNCKSKLKGGLFCSKCGAAIAETQEDVVTEAIGQVTASKKKITRRAISLGLIILLLISTIIYYIYNNISNSTPIDGTWVIDMSESSNRELAANDSNFEVFAKELTIEIKNHVLYMPYIDFNEDKKTVDVLYTGYVEFESDKMNPNSYRTLHYIIDMDKGIATPSIKDPIRGVKGSLDFSEIEEFYGKSNKDAFETYKDLVYTTFKDPDKPYVNSPLEAEMDAPTDKEIDTFLSKYKTKKDYTEYDIDFRDINPFFINYIAVKGGQLENYKKLYNISLVSDSKNKLFLYFNDEFSDPSTELNKEDAIIFKRK